MRNESQKEIEAINEIAFSTKTESIRVKKAAVDRIKEIIKRDEDHITLNNWINKAVVEKLIKDDNLIDK